MPHAVRHGFRDALSNATHDGQQEMHDCGHRKGERGRAQGWHGRGGRKADRHPAARKTILRARTYCSPVSVNKPLGSVPVNALWSNEIFLRGRTAGIVNKKPHHTRHVDLLARLPSHADTHDTTVAHQTPPPETHTPSPHGQRDMGWRGAPARATPHALQCCQSGQVVGNGAGEGVGVQPQSGQLR